MITSIRITTGLVGILLAIASSASFGYTLEIINNSKVNLKTSAGQTVDAGKSASVNIPGWGTTVQVNYEGKWAAQGFFALQRSSTFNVISGMHQPCANGRADLTAMLNSGIDTGKKISSAQTGNCSLDGGDTCKVSTSGQESNVKLTVTGDVCK
ncbi:hypothetical protein BH10PSE19_BH10PSE19_20830 [soil metagenome]